MANHPARVGAARDYEVPQVAVVVLYVALACAEGESLGAVRRGGRGEKRGGRMGRGGEGEEGKGRMGGGREEGGGRRGGRYLFEELAEAESHFAAAGFCVRGAGIAGYAFVGGRSQYVCSPESELHCNMIDRTLTTAPARQSPPSPS